MATHETHAPFPPLRVLITAGPTREPIDDVRFLGNRSSGSLGIALAEEAAAIGLQATLALAKSVQKPNIKGVNTIRFDQTSELSQLLQAQMPSTDILVMSAAVADHTPAIRHAGKLGRHATGRMTLELVPTPDLLAGVAANARPDQLLVGFALETRDRLESSALAKLETKRVDLIIANPLNTMESGSIEATLVAAAPFKALVDRTTRQFTKTAFANWIWPILLACHARKGSR